MTELQSAQESTPTAGGFLTRLYTRFEHLVRELGKFGIVGAVSFAIDLAVFNALLFADVHPLLAGTVSMVVAASTAFVGNRFWTWRDRERTNLRREYLLYFLFNLVGLAIALTCLWLSHYVLGATWPWFQGKIADNLAKNGLGMVLGTAFRFWSYRQIVFRKQS